MIFKNTLVIILSISIQLYFSQTNQIKKSTGQIESFGNIYYMVKGYNGYQYDSNTIKYHEKKLSLTELSFQHCRSTLYTREIMYNNFGMWNTETNNQVNPILIWENVKLLGNSNKLFTVITDGHKSTTNSKSSSTVMVIDQDGKDCLQEGSPYRDNITYFFSKGFEKLKERKFLTVYYERLYNQRQALAKKYGIDPVVGERTQIPREINQYIYSNGYNGISLLKIENDETTFNELVFNETSCACYTEVVMKKKWGKCSKKQKTKYLQIPLMQWDNIKLLEGINESFTVFTFGTESYDTIHSSVLVFDKNGKDCLAEDSPYKEKIIQYFAKEIKNLENKDIKQFF
ncbi:MAG: hypothetical protein JST62_08105 [Bacteroidetes bacterium]|nr:hypothetical protein [Bacteroidota bacterium]